MPHGVRALYLKPGQTEPAPDEWGSIAAWAWGLSRAMDYLETDKGVDAKRVAIMGVSRLGKTVMWAGAHDPRFAMVIASCSGEGGAALSRRNYGETIAHLTEATRYPYQFAANYAKFAGDVDDFPVDAHMLVALIAPRPVLLQTGDKDFWSDPKGEFLAAVAAGPVYTPARQAGSGHGSDATPPDRRSCTPSATTCTPAGMAPSRQIGISSWPSCRCTCKAKRIQPLMNVDEHRLDRKPSAFIGGCVCLYCTAASTYCCPRR